MLNITARGFKLREEIKDKIQGELRRVTKMLPENAEYYVTLTLERDEFKCDITIRNVGAFVRGEAIADEIMPAVDFAVDDLKRKLRKLKTKLQDRHDATAYSDIVANYEETCDDETDTFSIVREKNVSLSVMTDDEAILQMEMLGHSFFVYRDENGNTAVLYKRNNNCSYGKLICE